MAVNFDLYNNTPIEEQYFLLTVRETFLASRVTWYAVVLDNSYRYMSQLIRGQGDYLELRISLKSNNTPIEYLSHFGDFTCISSGEV